MTSNWPLKKISDVAYFRNSRRVPLNSLDRAKRQGKFPYYGASGVVDYIDDYIFDGSFLLISEDGENLRTRKTSIAFQAHGKFWVNNHAHILEEKEEGILDYLEYYFSILDLTPYITGAVQPKLNKANLDTIEIPIPPLDERRFLNRTLNHLRDKISVNNQTNQTLVQIAQALFKSWFVDFDPVRAKIEVLKSGGHADAELAAMSAIAAKDKKQLDELRKTNPDAFAKLAQTAALFPASMQDSEIGEIPEGWEVSDLASCTSELRRGISPQYIEEGGVLVINQKCIRNHTIDFSLARRNDSSKRKVDGREIAIGDVLVNSTGVGTLGRLSPIRYLNETTVVDSHVTVVRANTAKISKSFLAGLMITNEAYIEASGAGSTGQTELRKQVLEDIKFAKPLSAVDKLFDEIVGNFNVQVAEFEKQIVTLSLIRDALIPILLNGEINLTHEVVA